MELEHGVGANRFVVFDVKVGIAERYCLTVSYLNLP